MFSKWNTILEKKGAAHPLMNPYNMEANKNAPEITKDSCKKSLEILSMSAHKSINPDWTEKEIEEVAKDLINIRKSL